MHRPMYVWRYGNYEARRLIEINGIIMGQAWDDL